LVIERHVRPVPRIVVIVVTFILICAGVGAALLYVGSPAKGNNETLYQVSRMDHLSQGGYEAVTTVGALLDHGSVGMGTFTGMNGEMIMVDGSCYQAKVDGKVYQASLDWGVPFAQVGFFLEDGQVSLDGSMNMSVAQSAIFDSFPSDQRFYILRIDGLFDNITVRSIPVQAEPYPPLADVIANQSVFQYSELEGTIIGIWTPSFEAGSSTPGFHLHFVSADRTKGGHVLGFEVSDEVVRWDQISQYTTELE
jgi:acetolactate decarboxylase